MTGRIVFAEEDAGARRQIAVALRRRGYAVTQAGDGDEALAALDAAAPHLTLASASLPSLDGLAVCRRLRETRPATHLRII